MDVLHKGFFTELSDYWPGGGISLEVNKVLHHEKSEYQDVLVLETKCHGNALILDGVVQCTERDKFGYHEAISFLPLCSHPNPEKVLIIGGGAGCVTRELAKHPGVKSITEVEIDPMIIEVSKKYLSSTTTVHNHEKVKAHVGDGFKYLKSHSKEFDVIITDVWDSVGSNTSVFQESYFKVLSAALRPGGIVCGPAGSTWANLEQVAQTLDHCRSAFAVSAFGSVAVPTFQTGQIGFVVGSLNPETNFKEPVWIFSEKELDDMKMRYYSADVHRAAFSLPRFAAKVLHAD